MGVLLRGLGQFSPHRIHPNVIPMSGIVPCIKNAVIHVTPLPDFATCSEFPAISEGKASTDELHCSSKHYVPAQAQCEMNMIGHDYEFVNQELALTPIVVECL